MSAPLAGSGEDRSDASSAGPMGNNGCAPWQRLHSRMIWVDLVQSVLSLAPAGLAVWMFGVDPRGGGLWPLLAVAASGVIGAVSDALRWIFTRYRVTDQYVERRSGVLVRSYRSVRRDRIRSVDIEAKLRHRLAGLRVVNIGAGQQAAAGESALALDAVSAKDAEQLRHLLLRRGSVSPSTLDVDVPTADDVAHLAVAGGAADEQVLARFRPGWVVYNMLNIWAYIMALGLLWGGYWLADSFGIDVVGVARDTLDWEVLGWGWTIGIGVLGVSALGVIGLATNFFAEHWNFELARVPGEHGTMLRTRQGLLRTREVNRDDGRMRGVQIAEPVLWRWMGMADTTVITTGLSIWSMSQPTAILPRGPIGVARPVTAAVLATEPNPLEVPLRRHPSAALRRRLWWATAITATVVGMLGWLAAHDVIPAATLWAGVALGPVAFGAGVIAFRALGHAIAGEYVVFRSGLVSRATAALQRSAVSTIAIRESLLQRRLGLNTVSAMTAAGHGIYEAPDIAADEAIRFAADTATGILDPFLITASDQDVADAVDRREPG